MDKESLVILTLAKTKRRCYLNYKCLVFLIIVFIIVLSSILHSHLFLAKSEVLLIEAKDQRDKDAREERAVWKKTESKILMNPNHLSWENKNWGVGWGCGVVWGWGSPLFTLMVSRWCGGRLHFLALPQPASRMAARRICYNPACTVATPQTMGFGLYKRLIFLPPTQGDYYMKTAKAGDIPQSST